MNTEAMLPLPANVLARLQTAESLRAEVAGLTAERDALRTGLDTAGWERDTAQNEAAWMREEVLGKEWRDYLGEARPERRIGLLLTMGDVPPKAPEDEHAEDVALVSLSTAEVYVRVERCDDEWSRYGQSSITDFATMAERGPWITVGRSHLYDHKKRIEADRALYTAKHNAQIGSAEWPESVQSIIERLKETIRGFGVDAPGLISGWSLLASVVRSEWQSVYKRAAKLTEIIAGLPHEPEWAHPHPDDDTICVICCVAKADHNVGIVAAS